MDKITDSISKEKIIDSTNKICFVQSLQMILINNILFQLNPTIGPSYLREKTYFDKCSKENLFKILYFIEPIFLLNIKKKNISIFFINPDENTILIKNYYSIYSLEGEISISPYFDNQKIFKMKQTLINGRIFEFTCKYFNNFFPNKYFIKKLTIKSGNLFF